MIRINFCRTGASVSDWDIADKVEFFKSIIISRRQYIPQDPCPIYDFSNFLLFDAFRAEIAEDKISLDEICFSYEDELIPVTKYGACNDWHWPKVANLREDVGARTLKAAINKRRTEKTLSLAKRYGMSGNDAQRILGYEKEESSSLAKDGTEGQAPAPDRNSTTSGNQ
jgi:hypothetical protein